MHKLIRRLIVLVILAVAQQVWAQVVPGNLMSRIAALPIYRVPDVSAPRVEKARFANLGRFRDDAVYTCGVGPCVVVVVLDKKTGEQFFAHVSAPLTLDGAPSFGWTDTEAVLVGGWRAMSNQTVASILHFLDRQGVKKISRFHLMDRREEIGGPVALSVTSTVIKTEDGFALYLDVSEECPDYGE